MGREVKRVPLSFDWPLGEVWDGYLLPARLSPKPCDECRRTGYSPTARAIHDQWYNHMDSFIPERPWGAGEPEFQERARRNVESAPQFYGNSEPAVQREAERLARLTDTLAYHLTQADVDALWSEGMLGRLPECPSADAVNRWAISNPGPYGSVGMVVVVRARCARYGVSEVCSSCGGTGDIERWPGQRAETEAWEPTEPPAGDAWQMWETTSEGSPKTPPFETPEQLAAYCAQNVSVFGSEMATADRWLDIITGRDFAHVVIAPGVVMM